jgi:hypothetical protein
MKTFIALLIGVGMTVSIAWANPALLPKHPGYPASGNANDQGQTNAGGNNATLQSAETYGRHTQQELRPETGRDAIINENGAGRLPRHPGYYDYKIEPPVKEATRMPK